MLATEHPMPGGTPLTQADMALNGTSAYVKTAVGEMFTQRNGTYYVTPEMTSELKHIDFGADHIRLDNDFLRSSKAWGTKLNDPATIARDRAGATQALSSAAGAVNIVSRDMETGRVLAMQDNQVRQHHRDAIDNLRSAQKDMAPYAHVSIDRIRQFCDHIGVTDRYTGYRNNLNRGQRDASNPAHYGSYLGQADRLPAHLVPRPSACAGQLTNYTGHGDKRLAASAPPTTGIHAGPHNFPPKSIQERCGIVVKYPGISEYNDRFKIPCRGPNIGYQINPLPDYTITGRPMQRTVHTVSSTEYKGRYTWPDGSYMSKLPWLRK